MKSHIRLVPLLASASIERHNNTGSTGCPEYTNHEEEEEHPNHEEEEGTPTARTPTANSSRTVSYRRIGKHKGRVKQNATVSHSKERCRFD